MRVLVPSALRPYTGASRVEAVGDTLLALFADLDQRYPGIRFRMIDEQDAMREHIRIFVNHDEAQGLQQPLRAQDDVHLICALSGG